jgi:subtilisin family serine protease
MVKLVRANAAQLTEIIKYFAHVAELRRMEEPAGFFDELAGADQKQWTNELLSRTNFILTDTSICILDTGINAGHPLLKSAIDDECVQSVYSEWGKDDHDGHGTEVAGIALFHDLKYLLLQRESSNIIHHLESVKILPPKGNNEPELYGAITKNAVYIAETVRPQNKRAICMSVTSCKYNTENGRPTSWSGALDSLIVGTDEDNQTRLFFVSAGNVYPNEIKEAGYPHANTIHSVESPGQAWNAITVGAYTKNISIEDETPELP